MKNERADSRASCLISYRSSNDRTRFLVRYRDRNGRTICRLGFTRPTEARTFQQEVTA